MTEGRRIEGLCAALGRTLLASEVFVAAHGAGGWRREGAFDLKGIAGAQPVFARVP